VLIDQSLNVRDQFRTTAQRIIIHTCICLSQAARTIRRSTIDKKHDKTIKTLKGTNITYHITHTRYRIKMHSDMIVTIVSETDQLTALLPWITESELYHNSCDDISTFTTKKIQSDTYSYIYIHRFSKKGAIVIFWI